MALSGFNHSVQWSEFRTVNQRPTGVEEDAHIKARWTYTFSTQQPGGANCRVTTATVSITVDRNHTWVLRGQESVNLLQHEQGHYDITAIGARDLYNQILNLTAALCSNINTQVRRLQQQIQTQVDQINRRYDTRTNHGITAAQRTWDTNIRAVKRNVNGTLNDLPQ